MANVPKKRFKKKYVLFIIIGVTVILSVLGLHSYYVPSSLFPLVITQSSPLIENKNYQDAFIVRNFDGLSRIDATGKTSSFLSGGSDIFGYSLQPDRKGNKIFVTQNITAGMQDTIYSCNDNLPNCFLSPVVQVSAAKELTDLNLDLSVNEKTLLKEESLGLSNIRLAPNGDYIAFDVDATAHGQMSIGENCFRAFPMIYNMQENTIKPIIRNPSCTEDISPVSENWLDGSHLLIQDGPLDGYNSFAFSVAQAPLSEQMLLKNRIIGFAIPTIGSPSLRITPLMMTPGATLMKIERNNMTITNYSFIPDALLNTIKSDNVEAIEANYPTFTDQEGLIGIFNYQNAPLGLTCYRTCTLSGISLTNLHIHPVAKSVDKQTQTIPLTDIVYTIDRYTFDNGMTLVHISDNQPDWMSNIDYTNHYFLVDTFHNVYDNLLTIKDSVNNGVAYY